jgi:hypothetical protein
MAASARLRPKGAPGRAHCALYFPWLKATGSSSAIAMATGAPRPGLYFFR